MKILVIYQYLLEQNQGMGGSRYNQFARFWSKQGHQVTILAGMVHYASGQKNPKYKNTFIVKEKFDDNVTVIRCFVSAGYNKSFLGRFWAYINFSFSATIAGLFFTGKQDLIIASSPPLFAAIPGYLISRLKRIPLIFELRDLWPKFAIDLGILKNKLLIKMSCWLENFIYRKAKLINVLTPAFKKYLAEEKNISINKIIYVPNGADLDIFFPNNEGAKIRKKHGWQDKFIVLYVGAHGIANDLWQILDVAKEVKENKNIVFVLIGDGMEKNKLKESAKKDSLLNVEFLEPMVKKDLVNYVNAADVCTAILHPTFTTTYPNKVFDYMSCAKPIILPIAGAIKEVAIDEAKAGLFVEPKNTEMFKSAILDFYHHREKARKMGENGYSYVKKNFDRANLAKRYLEKIDRLFK